MKDLDVRVPQTISIADAESLLHCDQLINCLPFIRSVNNVRLPGLRATGNIELLPEGYDPESQVFTLPGGPEVEDMGFDTAKTSCASCSVSSASRRGLRTSHECGALVDANSLRA